MISYAKLLHFSPVVKALKTEYQCVNLIIINKNQFYTAKSLRELYLR